MIERNKPSTLRRKDSIYNPIEGKWERRLNSNYLGDLEDFSLEREISSRLTAIKDLELNKTRKSAHRGLTEDYLTTLKSSAKASMEKLEKWSEELFSEDEDAAEMIPQTKEENTVDYDREYESEEYTASEEDHLQETTEKPDFTWLKLLLAAVGLFAAILSN